jgi:hypothetical protein
MPGILREFDKSGKLGEFSGNLCLGQGILVNFMSSNEKGEVRYCCKGRTWSYAKSATNCEI